MLVAARAVQGLGGAVASAVALSLMMSLFTEPGERAKAMGVFGFVVGRRRQPRRAARRRPHGHAQLALDLPRQRADRHRSSTSLSLRLLPGAHERGRPRRLDVAGAVTVTVALMIAVYAIVNGNDKGWTSVADAGHAGRRRRRCIVRSSSIESRVGAPLVPLRLFKLRNLATSNVVGVLWAGGDVRVVLPLGAVPRGRCSATARSRSASRSCRQR